MEVRESTSFQQRLELAWSSDFALGCGTQSFPPPFCLRIPLPLVLEAVLSYTLLQAQSSGSVNSRNSAQACEVMWALESSGGKKELAAALPLVIWTVDKTYAGDDTTQ